jgi:hypothetical protein
MVTPPSFGGVLFAALVSAAADVSLRSRGSSGSAQVAAAVAAAVETLVRCSTVLSAVFVDPFVEDGGGGHVLLPGVPPLAATGTGVAGGGGAGTGAAADGGSGAAQEIALRLGCDRLAFTDLLGGGAGGAPIPLPLASPREPVLRFLSRCLLQSLQQSQAQQQDAAGDSSALAPHAPSSSSVGLPPSGFVSAPVVVQVALLRVLAAWMHGCGAAVRDLLADPSNLAYFALAAAPAPPGSAGGRGGRSGSSAPQRPASSAAALGVLPLLPPCSVAATLLAACFTNSDPGPGGDAAAAAAAAARSGASFTRETLLQAIMSRVGLSQFAGAVRGLLEWAPVAHAALLPPRPLLLALLLQGGGGTAGQPSRSSGVLGAAAGSGGLAAASAAAPPTLLLVDPMLAAHLSRLSARYSAAVVEAFAGECCRLWLRSARTVSYHGAHTVIPMGSVGHACRHTRTTAARQRHCRGWPRQHRRWRR